jgi:hypothetical protein
MSSTSRVGPGQGWQNAPTLTKLAASQQGGNRGAQLWGVQLNGKLNTIFQIAPGGGWSEWRGPDWAGPGYPKQVYELTAAQQNDGRVQFFALDLNLRMWAISQTSPGGDWSGWSGPNWNNAPTEMKLIVAAQQGGSRGAQLWGLTEDLGLVTCYQPTPGGSWSGWKKWPATPQNSQFIELTAAQQNDGRVQLWAVDTKLQLWSWYQNSPGGNWTAWSTPNWDGAPPLRNVIACQQGGSRGAQIWGIKPDFTLISNFQITPGGDWSGWSSGSWSNAPPVYELAAAQQNNGCIELWAVTTDQVLTAIGQTSPGGDWTGWS